MGKATKLAYKVVYVKGERLLSAFVHTSRFALEYKVGVCTLPLKGTKIGVFDLFSQAKKWACAHVMTPWTIFRCEVTNLVRLEENIVMPFSVFSLNLLSPENLQLAWERWNLSPSHGLCDYKFCLCDSCTITEKICTMQRDGRVYTEIGG